VVLDRRKRRVLAIAALAALGLGAPAAAVALGVDRHAGDRTAPNPTSTTTLPTSATHPTSTTTAANPFAPIVGTWRDLQNRTRTVAIKDDGTFTLSGDSPSGVPCPGYLAWTGRPNNWMSYTTCDSQTERNLEILGPDGTITSSEPTTNAFLQRWEKIGAVP
jgi:hypothetical protein